MAFLLLPWLSFIFSAETEVWNFETGQMKTIEPTLPNDEYVDGIALYFVDAGFCDKPNDY